MDDQHIALNTSFHNDKRDVIMDVVELTLLLKSLGFHLEQFDFDASAYNPDKHNESFTASTSNRSIPDLKIDIKCKTSGILSKLNYRSNVCSCPSKTPSNHSSFWEVQGREPTASLGSNGGTGAGGGGVVVKNEIICETSSSLLPILSKATIDTTNETMKNLLNTYKIDIQKNNKDTLLITDRKLIFTSENCSSSSNNNNNIIDNNNIDVDDKTKQIIIKCENINTNELNPIINVINASPLSGKNDEIQIDNDINRITTTDDASTPENYINYVSLKPSQNHENVTVSMDSFLHKMSNIGNSIFNTSNNYKNDNNNNIIEKLICARDQIESVLNLLQNTNNLKSSNDNNNNISQLSYKTPEQQNNTLSIMNQNNNNTSNNNINQRRHSMSSSNLSFGGSLQKDTTSNNNNNNNNNNNKRSSIGVRAPPSPRKPAVLRCATQLSSMYKNKASAVVSSFRTANECVIAKRLNNNNNNNNNNNTVRTPLNKPISKSLSKLPITCETRAPKK